MPRQNEAAEAPVCRNNTDNASALRLSELDTTSIYHRPFSLHHYLRDRHGRDRQVLRLPSQIGTAHLNFATSYHVLVVNSAEYTRSYRPRYFKNKCQNRSHTCISDFALFVMTHDMLNNGKSHRKASPAHPSPQDLRALPLGSI